MPASHFFRARSRYPASDLVQRRPFQPRLSEEARDSVRGQLQLLAPNNSCSPGARVRGQDMKVQAVPVHFLVCLLAMSRILAGRQIPGTTMRSERNR